MSLGSGPMSPKRWRPLEQIGWAFGILAGGVVLLCLFAFSISQQVAGLVTSVLPKA